MTPLELLDKIDAPLAEMHQTWNYRYIPPGPLLAVCAARAKACREALTHESHATFCLLCARRADSEAEIREMAKLLGIE